MTTTYPGAIDTVSDAPNGNVPLGASTPKHTEVHQKLADVVNALQTRVGTSANPTFAERSKLPLNIKDYGAIGDNLTHPLSGTYASDAAAQAAFPRTHAAVGVTLSDQLDWAATQEALYEAAGATIKRSVFAPAGRYRTHRRLVVPDGVLFAGEGGTHEQSAYPRTVFRAIADDFCMLYANSFSIVRDITIDCYDKALWGIHLGPGNRPQLQQVLVNRAKQYGIVLDRTQNGIYYSCTTYYCWRGVVLLNGARNNCFFGFNASTDSRYFVPSGDRTYVTSCILLYLIDLTDPSGFGTTNWATENGNDRNQFYGGIWERTSQVVKTENPNGTVVAGMGEHADSVFNGIEFTFYGAGTGRAVAAHSTFKGRFTFRDCYFRGPDPDTVTMEGSSLLYAYFDGSCFFYNAGDNLPFRGVNLQNNLVQSISSRSADEIAPDPSAGQDWYYAGGTTNNTITWDATLRQFTVAALAPADRGLGCFPRGIIGRGNGNALRKTFYAAKLTVRVKWTIDAINAGAGQYMTVAASFGASPWRRKLGDFGLGPHEVVFTTTPGTNLEQGGVEFLTSGCYNFKISGISVEVL